MHRRLASLPVACAALCLVAAGCGGGSSRAELRVSLDAVPNNLPGKWDAAVKVTWNNARSGRRLAVPLPDNGTVDVFRIEGPADYRMSILIEPVDHSSASGVCQRAVSVPAKKRFHATVHVTRRGSCTIDVAPS